MKAKEKEEIAEKLCFAGKRPAAAKTKRGCVRTQPSRRNLCHSYAPSGLAQFPFATHGLRRGLHSYAAFAAGKRPGSALQGAIEFATRLEAMPFQGGGAK